MQILLKKVVNLRKTCEQWKHVYQVHSIHSISIIICMCMIISSWRKNHLCSFSATCPSLSVTKFREFTKTMLHILFHKIAVTFINSHIHSVVPQILSIVGTYDGKMWKLTYQVVIMWAVSENGKLQYWRLSTLEQEDKRSVIDHDYYNHGVDQTLSIRERYSNVPVPMELRGTCLAKTYEPVG